jgi:23S rRNA pseudouridine1911/1915/1917 synthase
MIFSCDCGGGRLDFWLAGKLDCISRSGVQKCIKNGNITVNGVPVPKNYIIKTGDRVFFDLPQQEPVNAEPQDIKLDVIYEDDSVIVINKPRGMVVHPGNGNSGGTLVNALAFRFAGGLSDAGGPRRPGIVHRLDKDTSGLVVAAKTNEAHYKLAAEFKARRVRKIYNAIACGRVPDDYGRIEMPIGRHATDRTRMAVPAEGGRDAVTLFKVVERLPCGFTWLELEIPTGRTHQIRVHLARIGYPVVGDPVYGRGKINAVCAGIDKCALWPPDRKCPLAGAADGQLLHSTELEFAHPATGERMRFISALPEYFPARGGGRGSPM